MKREKLLDALDKLYPAVSSAPIVEEMADFRIDGNKLRTADGMVMVQVTLPDSTALDCRVKAEPLYKLLSSLNDEDITFTVEGDKLTVKGNKLKGKYDTSISTETEYLDGLNFEVDEWLDIPKGMLEGIRLCKFAVSNDVSRGSLCGLLMKKDGVLASDGGRIGWQKCTIDTLEKPVIMTAQLAAQLDKYIDGITGWALKDDTIYFAVGPDVVIAGKALAYSYPEADVVKILGQMKDLKSKIVLPDGLEDVLRRHLDQQLVSGVSSEDKEVQVDISGGALKISSTGISYNFEEGIGLKKQKRSSMSLKLDPAFLLDILGHTREMLYGEGQGFIGFKFGKFRYVMGVEIVE